MEIKVMDVQEIRTQKVSLKHSPKYEQVVGSKKNAGRSSVMAKRRRIMMISTHGYVSAIPELGMRDTGGQVVYVLELSKAMARMGYHVDILTRRFEGQPREERVAERLRILRFPCGGPEFIPKEILCDHISEWITNAIQYIEGKRLQYAFINSHYWDTGLAGQGIANHFGIPLYTHTSFHRILEER
jgi:mannosylfructose-phosphate synthase